MNRLSKDDQVKIVAALVEGNSIRSTSRMTGLARNTITKLLVDLGQACMKFHDEHVRNVRVRRLQCDEIWAYVGAKAKNVTREKKEIGWGDVWTWVGIDADTKLVVSYLVGGRGADWASDFMKDAASRIQGRVQITTDGHKAYLSAVEEAFGADVDYAQLQKIYGSSLENVYRLRNERSQRATRPKARKYQLR
jgi:IS1 family transposase